MEVTRSAVSRRELLGLSGLALGSIAVSRTGRAAETPQAPGAPVSVAKVASYDLDLVAQFERMFDELGGIGQRVRGKTVAMKLNMTGSSGKGRPSVKTCR